MNSEEIKEKATAEGIFRASQHNMNRAEAGYNAKWFKRGALFGAELQAKTMYSEEDMKELFIEGYKQRAEKSDLIFDNASRMYAIHLFEKFKKEKGL
ncbi:hypothetical protein [Flavobacterium sp.]|uniref:hypothetical protein n=1 Tax=Flavobacterium sp. TaxID=239 RepID=UPI0025CD902B|nr:hypothetical protein [Flavobacterium sp.]